MDKSGGRENGEVGTGENGERGPGVNGEYSRVFKKQNMRGCETDSAFPLKMMR